MRRLLPLALAAVTAHAGDVAQLVAGPAYEPGEEFALAGRTLRGYAAVDPAAAQGAFYFLARDTGSPAWDHAYRVDRAAARLDAYVLAADADPATAEATRIMAAARTASDRELARDLAEAAAAAHARWSEHQPLLPAAHAADPAEAHAAWRRIVLSLERAHENHPRHLGILRDLIVAYTQLNAFEHATTTADNLCRLIPARIAEFEEAVGRPTDAERITLRRARAMLFFECGLHPLAADAVRDAPEDPELATLGRALAALGQDDFKEQETFEVAGALAAYEVSVFETRGAPAADRLLHDELYFLTRPKGAQGPVGRAWYVLSRQAVDGRARYYLYGCSGESRSLLMMYGAGRPGYATAKGDVEGAMQRALARPLPLAPVPATETAFGKVMLIALAALVLLVLVALALRKTRTP